MSNAIMTTIDTLTVFQVQALQVEAERAGDNALAADCHKVDAAYWLALAGDLQGALAESGDDERAAAHRIVEAIRDTEAHD